MTFSLYDGFMFWQEFYEKIDADLISVLLASKMQNNKERGHKHQSHKWSLRVVTLNLDIGTQIQEVMDYQKYK